MSHHYSADRHQNAERDRVAALTKLGTNPAAKLASFDVQAAIASGMTLEDAQKTVLEDAAAAVDDEA